MKKRMPASKPARATNPKTMSAAAFNGSPSDIKPIAIHAAPQGAYPMVIRGTPQRAFPTASNSLSPSTTYHLPPTTSMHIKLQRKVAQGNEGLWFVMQQISGSRRWVPLAGVKISRQEAETYLA